MKRYVVVAYPKLSAGDYGRIQEIRRINDSLFTVVEPHFTLVFPFQEDGLSVEDLVRHVEEKVRGHKAIRFKLTEAVSENNQLPANYETHLIASEGADEITELHDSLYKDLLASKLRGDILYRPHITVANQSDQDDTQKLTDTLKSEGIAIKGTIDSVTVGLYDGTQVAAIKTFELL